MWENTEDAAGHAGHTRPAERKTKPLFPLGQVVATPAVLEHFDRHAINAQDYLDRHVRGDWGDLCPEDAAENDLSVSRRLRILSSYQVAGEKIWIITEADRSSTTLLFPAEY